MIVLHLSFCQPCGTGAVDGGQERAHNFKKVLDVFFGGSIPVVEPVLPSSGSSSPGSSPQYDSSPSSAKPAELDKWYPDYNGNWALGKCINVAPLPGGRPTYDTGVECCEKAYGGQASGACLSSVPQAFSSVGDLPFAPLSGSSGESFSSGKWYPDYNSQFALGKCISKSPIPNGIQSYYSGFDCCNHAYANQASGACLESLPRLYPTLKDQSPEFRALFNSTAPNNARQKNNLLAFNCGGGIDIPLDALIIDILFDYEIAAAPSAQPGHILPSLKKQIMDDLASKLGCQGSLRRNLRQEDGELLGFYSGVGGDVIDSVKSTYVPCFVPPLHFGASLKL